jgi:acetyltransferase
MKLPPGYPIECERIAKTRDGVEYRIRPIRPDDLERLLDFGRGLSEESRYSRLMYAVDEPTEALLKPFVDIDYQQHMALIALVTLEGVDRIVGVARYAIDGARREHEFALVVTDAWQGHGIGTALLRDLFDYGRRHGVRRVVGTVLQGNERMLSLVRRLGLQAHTSPQDPSLVTLSLDL